MKMKHTVTLNKEQLKIYLIKSMDLPGNTVVRVNVSQQYDQMDRPYGYGFDNVELSYETELDNVPYPKGSTTTR